MTGESRTVALLFSDIAGSTEKWARLGSAMGKALERHDQLASSVFADHGAILSKHTSDRDLLNHLKQITSLPVLWVVNTQNALVHVPGHSQCNSPHMCGC